MARINHALLTSVASNMHDPPPFWAKKNEIDYGDLIAHLERAAMVAVQEGIGATEQQLSAFMRGYETGRVQEAKRRELINVATGKKRNV